MSIPTWFDPKAYFDNKLAKMDGYNELTLTAAFNNAGFIGDEGLYAHYVRHGASEGISPNAYFNVDQYMYAKAQAYFGTHEVSQNQIRSMFLAFENAGLTPWQHYLNHVWDEMISPSNEFDNQGYLKAKLAQMQAEDPGHGWTMAELTAVLQEHGFTPLTHYLAHGIDENLDESLFIGTGNVGVTKYLSEGKDSIFGSADGDYFYAGLGELSTNDYIDGGTGNDTLEALLGVSPDGIAIRPTILNVEKIIFQAQTNSGGGGGNTVSGRANEVSVDAGAISGMRTLQNLNSRDSLVVEDVRINSDLMTISWKNADPGLDVDYEVYFNPQNLVSEGAEQSGTITIQLLDVRNAQLSNGATPLLDQPWDKFTFAVIDADGNDHQITLTLEKDLVSGVNATYATLLQAFREALAVADPNGQFELTASLGGTFPASASVAGDTFIWNQGQNLMIRSGNSEISVDSTEFAYIGWGTTSGTTPPVGGIVWNAVGTSDFTCPLITTNIHLDNVGRVLWDDASDCIPDNAIFGSEAGDMIVGSMADRGGIERFNVTVESGSWLSSLASTNNTLRMIEVQEGSKGQLFIGEQLNDNASGRPDDLWGPSSWTAKAHLLSTDGVVDVKYFDASALDGNANIGASITAASNAKYLAEVDGVDTTAEGYAPNGPFQYTFGSKADILNMDVNSGIAADNDFVLNISMGAGNDLVNFTYSGFPEVGSTPNNQLANMYAKAVNAQHVTIDGGAGADTVWTWGNGVIAVNGGEGNDALYVGQLATDLFTGELNAVWVYNIGDESITTNKMVLVDDLNGAQPLNNDLIGDVASFDITGAANNEMLRVTVNFKGFEATYDVALSVNIDGEATVSAAVVNRAIIAAIENDDVLSKILVGKDGSGYSLIIESLINGEMEAGDLAISFSTRIGDTDGTADVTAITGAYVDDVFAEEDTFGTLTGSDDGTVSYNVVDGGAGNDVIVLNVNPSDVVVDSAGDPVDFIDVLKLTGTFGNDSVFNFDAEDLVDVSAYAGATVARTANVLNNAGIALTGTNTLLTEAQAAAYATTIADWDGGGATAFISGVLAIRIGTGVSATNTWQFFQVTNTNGDTDIVTGEVKSLGTITFDDDSAAVVAAATAADFFA